MRRRQEWVAVSLVAVLAGCGSTLVLPSPDAGSNDGAARDIPAPLDVPVADVVATGMDAGFDAPADASVDALSADASDAPALTDGPPKDDPFEDAAACPAGITDECPAAFPGVCDDLADGEVHVLNFGGLRAGLRASCEGAMTAAGPDGVVPLTLTTPSDVVLTGTPSAGDAVVLTLASAARCGDLAGELRCSNSSANGSGGVATVRAATLAPGTYAVTASTAQGLPARVQAVVTPARPRLRGDVCPGVVVMPDGPPVTLSTAGFATDADYGTSCGSGAAPAGWSDAVFSYTLAAARDVTLEVSAPGAGPIALTVGTRCGDRSSVTSGCVAGDPARRVLRNPPPGTYSVVVEHRAFGAAGRPLSMTVITAAPTPASAADACPGAALVAGVATTVPVTGLSGGTAIFACLPSRTADAAFSFVAPPTGDVLVSVAGSNGAEVASLVEAPCGGAPLATGACVGPATVPAWRRVSGLTAGQTYTVVAGTDGAAGTLAAQYLAVPAATATAVTANDACATPFTVPATGGVFHGSSATAAAVQAACGGPGCGGGRAVYFALTLPARKRVIATTLGSAFDTVLAVGAGDACAGRPMPVACNDDTLGQASQVDATLAAGTYWIELQGCGLRASGDWALDVAVVDP